MMVDFDVYHSMALLTMYKNEEEEKEVSVVVAAVGESERTKKNR